SAAETESRTAEKRGCRYGTGPCTTIATYSATGLGNDWRMSWDARADSVCSTFIPRTARTRCTWVALGTNNSASTAQATMTQPPPPAPPQPPSTTSQGTAIPAGPDGREPSYIELLARSETRRRIRSSGSTTYLGEMIEATGDSMLRRWENRMTEPIRVWFAPTHAANFKPAFIDAIKSGFGVWTAAGVPVRFQFDGDSTNAEVTV